MTAFYGTPGADPFWHWTTLVHFVLVALAGGTAFFTAVVALKRPQSLGKLPWLALAFIALDLLMLWAESPARFRFSHVWLFFSFEPAAAIWWGAWGLALSALLLLLLGLRLGPVRTLGGFLAFTSAVVLAYPGYALAVNAARPLWDHLLLALFPATGLLLALAVLALLRPAETALWLEITALVSLALTALYPVALASGGADARVAYAQWLRGWLWFAAASLLLFLGAFLARRNPAIAAACAFAGAALLRSWIVEEGQRSLFAHGF
ncbi:MAG TPA: hypothetical protein ENK37_07560 [Oceanithermus profundus]|uniref:Polysulfide reductase n=1 Tax=Oceanithermus profundus TaxID=187137 RepID=A0A7C4ZDT5_9DEIN|nr:hypothetical protein [Oceanithermus profundus]